MNGYSDSSELSRACLIINKIAPHYPIKSVGIFGSVARGESKPDSDLDVAVAFDDDKTSSDILGFIADLSEDFGTEVDVITSLEGCSSFFFDELERDMVLAYER